jgi:hypothetical protein
MPISRLLHPYRQQQFQCSPQKLQQQHLRPLWLWKRPHQHQNQNPRPLWLWKRPHQNQNQNQNPRPLWLWNRPHQNQNQHLWLWKQLPSHLLL